MAATSSPIACPTTISFLMRHFLLLSYDHGRWRDDTKTLLPVAYKKTHTYNLPRHGTHIEVVAPDGEKLYTLVWVNDRFVIRRSPRK
jgi:hypothetical protein